MDSTTRLGSIEAMKRIGRIVGFIGGVAAVIWAMRDRLISIATPSEPEPPRFRVVSPSPTERDLPPSEATTDDLTLITGVGPVYASRLRAAGFDSFEKIAAADDETLAGIVGVSERRVEGWSSQAAEL